MLMDCTDRLDHKGYHRLSVTREDTLARWDCTVETKEDDWVEGDAIVAYQCDGAGNVTEELKLKLGDVVYLSGSRKLTPAEIGKIVIFAAQPEVDHIWLTLVLPRGIRVFRMWALALGVLARISSINFRFQGLTCGFFECIPENRAPTAPHVGDRP